MKKYDAKVDFLRGSSSDLPRVLAGSLVALALGLCMVRGASAGVVFEQPPVGGNDSFLSISAAQTADDFVLSANTPVSELVWWGSYSNDPATLALDKFRVRVSADDGTGSPAIVPLAEFTLTPTRMLTLLADVSGAEVYRYKMALPSPLILAGGSTFYLSVVNQFDISDPDANWYWLLADTSGQNFYRSADGDPWSSDLTGNLAFQISGSAGAPIPLPGSLLLLLTGLAALSLVGSRGHGRLASCRIKEDLNCSLASS